MKRLFAFLPLTLALASCQTVDEAPARTIARATLLSQSGAPAGTARAFSSSTETTVTVSLTGLPTGRYDLQFAPAWLCERRAPSPSNAVPAPGARQQADAGDKSAQLPRLPGLLIGNGGSGTTSALLPGSPAEMVAMMFGPEQLSLVVQHADGAAAASARPGHWAACGVFVRD